MITIDNLPVSDPLYFITRDAETITWYLKKNRIFFSKTVAARLVGGRARLLRLISQNRIQVSKPSNTQNGKWMCSAGDVLRYIDLPRPMTDF